MGLLSSIPKLLGKMSGGSSMIICILVIYMLLSKGNCGGTSSGSSSCCDDTPVDNTECLDCKPCGGCYKCVKHCPKPYADEVCDDELMTIYKPCCCRPECLLEVTVQCQQLCIPQYIIRKLPDCGDFYFNFEACKLTNQMVNSLIMLKDLLQWMTEGVSLSDEDLPDGIYPVVFIAKENNKICTFEYLKIFINTDDCNVKSAFVIKGDDYTCIKDKIDVLIECGVILDLLQGQDYYTYNLSETCPESLLEFLKRYLSLFTLSEVLIGQTVIYDLSYCHEFKKLLEYFYEYYNCDMNMSTVVC